jgi:uncharacterized protein
MSDPPEIPPEVIELAHQLFDLARAGDSTLLQYVDRGAPANLTDSQGNTLLMLAAYHGHAALVTGLAERGADVDAVNDRGQSPLAAAAFKGAADVVQALMDADADPEKGSPNALETARFFERHELLEAMRP